MTEEQKKERIKKLWGKVRVISSLKMFLTKMADDNDNIPESEKFKLALGLEDENEEEGHPSPYILDLDPQYYKIWELIMVVPMWYLILFSPIFLIWPHFQTKFAISLWVQDVFFLVDFFILLLKPDGGELTVCEVIQNKLYVKSFWCNLLATFPVFFTMHA